MGALLEALAEILFFGTTYSGTRSSEPAVTLAAVFIVACILGMISMVVVPDAVIETMALRWIVLAMAPFFTGCVYALTGIKSNDAGYKFGVGFILAFGFLLVRHFFIP